MTCIHVFKHGICEKCGFDTKNCKHSFKNGICQICGFMDSNEYAKRVKENKDHINAFCIERFGKVSKQSY